MQRLKTESFTMKSVHGLTRKFKLRLTIATPTYQQRLNTIKLTVLVNKRKNWTLFPISCYNEKKIHTTHQAERDVSVKRKFETNSVAKL